MKALGDFEAEVESVEALISQAVAYGLAEKPEVGRCHDDLGGVRAQIQSQRQMLYQMGVRETAQKVEGWLQKIEEFEALLQSDRPVEDIPMFLDRIEVEQQAIEKDPTFAALQTLTTTKGKIRQTVDQMKLRIKRRLVRILVEDVGRRDEKLVRMEKEAAKLEEELFQAQEEVARARVDLNKVRHHELHRYFIPFSLLVALLTGGMLAAQVQSLPGLVTIRWVALAFLVVYFAYYVWVYYISSSLSD
jgi:hypothetical protein